MTKDEICGLLRQIHDVLAMQSETNHWAKPTPAEYAMGYAEGFNDACKPNYTALPQRTWVGLTDEEVVRIKLDGRDLEFISMTALRRFAKDIAQALKEKNQ
jgi:sulfite reductase beta subunit-like hemoprotein